MNKETFEEFLNGEFFKEFVGTKETFNDDFNDWVVELEWDDIIEYADEFNKEMLDKQKEEMRQIIKQCVPHGHQKRFLDKLKRIK